MPSILNSDDGVVSGTSGLKTTGGNDGITAFQQNGTERMRIDSSGNVGIGTSSPLEKLQVAGPVVSTANLAALRASTMTMDYISGGRLIATGADSSTYSPIIFGTATTTTFAERGRFEANGNLKLALNLSVGSATPTTSGTGITFPATQSASSDANTLDDYEEGTYTMTFTPGSGSITLSTNTANYTKIGRVVVVNAYVVVGSVSSPSGSLNINLPFTSANLSGSGRASPWISFNGLGAGGNISTAWTVIDANSSSAVVYVGGGTTVTNNFASYVSTSTDARITMVYIT